MSTVSIILEADDEFNEEESNETLGSSQNNLSVQNALKVVTSDEEFDTDIEIEDTKEEYDATGKKTYFELCKRLDSTPVSYFLKHMADPEINLAYHGIGTKGAKAVAGALVVNTVTLTVNLTENSIGFEGTRAISDMLRENCYITDLNLSSNYLGPEGCNNVCDMLQQNLNLRKLDLSKNRFGDSVGNILAEAFKNNFKLSHLDLSSNDLGEKAGIALGPGVNANDAMEYLNLRCNQLNRKATVEIAHGLRANCTLKVLDLSWNGFSDFGAVALADALKANNTLTELNICNNRIHDDGAVALAKALDSNNTLEILKLNVNPLTEKGALLLLNSINNKSDSAIHELHIMGVFIQDEFLKLYKQLRENKEVIVLADFRDLTPLEKVQRFIKENKDTWLEGFHSVDEGLVYRVPIPDFFDILQNLGLDFSFEDQIALLGKMKKDSRGRIKYRDPLLGFQKEPPAAPPAETVSA